MFYVHVCMYTTCMPGAYRGRKMSYSPGIGVTHGCESPCECWDMNLGPLKEQPLFFTAEPSL